MKGRPKFLALIALIFTVMVAGCGEDKYTCTTRTVDGATVTTCVRS